MLKSELYKKTIDKWGVGAQVEMAVEECSELIKAIQKLKDVAICKPQLMYVRRLLMLR